MYEYFMTLCMILATTRRVVTIPPLPSTFKYFEWPTVSSLRASQDNYVKHHPDAARESAGLWHLPCGSFWIPHSDDTLQLRLCILAHTDAAANRSAMATIVSLSRELVWSTLSEDVDFFVSSCIHCLSTTGKEKFPDLSARPSSAPSRMSSSSLPTLNSVQVVPAKCMY